MTQRNKLANFVILTQARTGSTMLQSMLDNHPRIQCFGEIFNPGASYGYEKWKGRSIFRKMANRYLRDYCVEKYLTSLRDLSSKKPLAAVGFKVIYPGQFDRWPDLRYFWRTRDFKVISLTRKNVVRKYLSSRIANIEGQWNSKESRSTNIRIRVDTQDLMRYIQRVSVIYKIIDELTYEFRGIRVSYEGLSLDREKVLREILDYLGNIDFHEDALRARTVKQNPEPIERLIDNIEEVHEALSGTAYEWCLEEHSADG